MQVGGTRRQLSKKHIFSINEKLQIQMDILSEGRDPIGTLQYALARKRGKENQQKKTNNNRNNNDIHPIGTTEVHYISCNNIQQRAGILSTTKTGPITDCWKCGYEFVPDHLHTPGKKKEKNVECARKQDITQKLAKQKCHTDQNKEHGTETAQKAGA